MKLNLSPTITARKDANIILALFIFSFILFSNFDVLEKIVLFSQEHEDYEIDEIFSSLIVLSFAAIVYAFRRQRETQQALRDIIAINEELESALKEIKTLKGFIPICASCKKIKSDSGSWEQLESYLRKNSNAEFSHSYCPTCYEHEMKAIDELEESRK